MIAVHFDRIWLHFTIRFNRTACLFLSGEPWCIVKLYTFGSTRRTDVQLTSHGHRRETARARSEIVGTLTDIARAPYDFHLKSAETLRFPYDLHTVLTRNIEESHNKKSYDARLNCKRLRRSPLSVTMSKIS